MKKVFLYTAIVMFMGVAGIQAQTLSKGAVLVGGDGDRITLGAPASVDAHKLLLPGTLGVANSLLYITSVGGSTVSTSWIPPGNTGDVLAYVSGALTWTPVASLPALTFWSLLGNSNIIIDNTNNLLGTTTVAPLRIITGGAANTRILISATGAVTVNGTAGTTNVSMTSLGAATGTTGRVMFATDATGTLNALAVPASNGQILTSTTGGVLSWTSSPALDFWGLTGNGHTVVDGTNNLLGTTTAASLRLITGGTTRVTIGATGGMTVAGTSGTENVRVASLASATTAVDGGVVYADAQGDLNRLAAPGTSNFVLTSETDGTLIWQNANSLVSSGGIHEEASAGSDNIRRKAAYITGTAPTVGGTGANDFQHNRNASGQTATGTRSTILGGQKNTASGETSAIVNGDTVVASGKYSLIGNGNANFATNEGTTVLNGLANTASGTYVSILGGTGLTMSNQFGAGYNGATSTGTPQHASISSGNVFYLGNVDLWLGNTRNQASQIRFYEAQSATGTFPGGSTNYSSFQAGSQSADFVYTLPITIPTSNQVLTATSVSAPNVTLGWTTPGAGSNWTLTGNSGTTAGTNFIGTTDAVDWVIKTGGSAAGNERARVTAGGRIGIGNISDVRTTVDINGDYGTRYTSLSLSSGANHNINPGAFSYVRITGPTANFSITGMRSGANGKRITLYNTTSYTMDIDYESGSSQDTTRFRNPIATKVTIYAGGTASFIYDAVLNRWILTSYTNGFIPQIASQILRRKAADETISAANTTMQDDDHLQWPVVTGQVWEVRGVMFIEAATANPDFNFQFVSPGGTGDSVSGYWRLYKLGGGGGGSLNDADLLTGYSTPSSSMGLNATTVYAVELNGVFVVGNTSGDVKIQWAKTTGVADNLTVKKNSYLFITRIE